MASEAREGGKGRAMTDKPKYELTRSIDEIDCIYNGTDFVCDIGLLCSRVELETLLADANAADGLRAEVARLREGGRDDRG